MILSKRLFTFALLACPFIGTGTLFANQTTWNFSGVVRNYLDLNSKVVTTIAPPEFAAVGVVPGTPLNGHVTFDLGASTVVVGAGMNVGTLSSQFDPNGFMLTFLGNTGGLNGLRGMDAFYGLTDSQGINIVTGVLQLYGTIGTVFPTGNVPMVPPSLSSLKPFDPTVPDVGTRFMFSAPLPSGHWGCNIRADGTECCARAISDFACACRLARSFHAAPPIKTNNAM